MTVADEQVDVPPTGRVVPTLPSKPGPSFFAIGVAIAAIALTIVTAIAVDFSLGDIITNFSRKNSVIEGLFNPDWGQIWSRRSRSSSCG